MKILVVEDEVQLADTLAEILKRNKYNVDTVFDGDDGLEYARTGIYDCILLDIMLHVRSGTEIVQILRREKNATPIMLLTAKSEVEDKIHGLDCGADDYLTKPIKMKLLVSRVQAILKRIDAETAPAEPAAAGIAVDRERYTVTRDGNEIALPRKEFALLDLLYSSPGKLFSREEIYTKIWGTEVVVGDRTIDVHIRKLRQKIGDERIVTIKGVGYKFEP